MPFDIESYKANSKRLDLSDLDWDAVPRHRLPQGTIDSMFYMMDIETHTAIYLSELLVSKACMDPVITAFLSIWAYEEMYHGDAFVRFLRAYGIPVSDDRPREIRLSEGMGRIGATLGVMFGSYLFPFFPAVYLTIGATNELTTLTGYRRLISKSEHPVLTKLLTKIIKQERVHYAFYRSMAEKHLKESAAARGLTRWFMEKRFAVVGQSVKSPQEVDALALYLFDGPEGREAAHAIDHDIGELPGLRGFRLLQRVLDRAYERSGTSVVHKSAVAS